MTRSAVKPRAAPGLDKKAFSTLSGPWAKRTCTLRHVWRNTGPCQPGGAFFSSQISSGICRNITTMRRTSSLASSSAREKHTTVRPENSATVHAATESASQVMPSWRAFKMTFSLCACSWRRASSCMGHSRKGCTSSAASLSSMCTKFLVKNTGSCLHRATVFSRSSCGVMPMPPFRVVCRAVGRAPGAKRQRRLGLLQRKTGLFQTARIRRVVKNRRSAPAKRSPCAPFFPPKAGPLSPKKNRGKQRLCLKRKSNRPPRPSLPP